MNFFHLDCLASEVRLNVDLDAALTVIANGCYRWLARRLQGFEKAKPKQLYRKFVETGGVIEVAGTGRCGSTFDRRSHNPILREAALDRDGPHPLARRLPRSVPLQVIPARLVRGSKNVSRFPLAEIGVHRMLRLLKPDQAKRPVPFKYRELQEKCAFMPASGDD